MHDPVAEEEAKWLGPTLLVPNEAALHILERRMSVGTAEKIGKSICDG
jgi:hypothetical protein